MSQLEQLDALEAIDATLAGEPADPRFADLAELALLLREERPDPPSSAVLDERVLGRFQRAAPRRRLGVAWLLAPAAGALASVAVAIVIVVGQGSHPARPNAISGPALTTAASAAPRRPLATGTLKAAASTATFDARKVNGASQGTPETFAPSTTAPVLAPLSNGRKIIQGAQLALSARPSRIQQVSQEVFQVAGRFNAIVRNSTITAAGPGSYAQFQLSIPSASLGQAMTALSTVPYAHVASRTDNTQDVNDQYVADQRRLGEARALRTSLLKQLAAATTQTEIDSLTSQIHDADASISSDEATLRGLNRQIAYSQVTVMVNAQTAPAPVAHKSGGFTLGQAAHDAGRVLTVAAGVALIGLAALLPVALLTALGWWGWAAVLRRRREHALDTA